MQIWLYRLTRLAFDVAELILLARVVISWLPVDRDNRLVVLLHRVTEPILSPIRSMIRRSSFGHQRFLTYRRY